MNEPNVPSSSAESSDRETDKFEDAPDEASSPITNTESQETSSKNESSTEAAPSSANSTPRISQQIEKVADAPTALTVEVDPVSTPKFSQENDRADDQPPIAPVRTIQPTTTSSVDELSTNTDGTSDHDRPTRANTVVDVDKTPSATRSSSRGLSATLPSLPWGSSSSTKITEQKPATVQNPAPKRFGTGLSSWLSRKGSQNADMVMAAPSQSPTGSSRRDTITSISSLASNPELMLSKLGEDGHTESNDDDKSPRNSLRDRFKMLRMREEAGIQPVIADDPKSPDGYGSAFAGLIGRSASLGLGIGSPTTVVDEKEGGLAVPPALTSQNSSPVAVSPIGLPTEPDTSLAPGTASGMAAGPSVMIDPEAPVDWDLWQAVVYEGPSAVARSSAEELSRAIATGIPHAIRGVVWQVLAQSKNEELEIVYRELVVRGTEKDRELAAGLQGHQPSYSLINGTGKDNAATTSSASSIHSDHSTAATSATNGLASPTPSQLKDSEAIAKSQAAVIAERQKKAKEDRASLQKLEKAIRRDLGARTSYSKYAVAAGLQEGLFGVCKAYALFDEGVGYAQGMNFLVMPLLFNMPEEEAFCLLVRLMNQYHLREMFIQDMPGLHLHLYQFERLLEDLEPALYCHLHRRNVAPQLYATQWFLTLFAYRFPLQLVLRIYDLILSEGLEGAILKFGIVLMQKNAETLLGMNDMASLTNFLKDRLFDIYIDQTPSNSSLLESGFFGSSGGIDKEIYRADVLVQDACSVKITPEMLKVYTSEWEEKVQVEKEREVELEGLRSHNTSLSQKVRSLEERTEKSDTEHVQMASELVKTKVENQELLDQVESLKGQTTELRAMVDTQTQEVEARLKNEMDRIMERNSHVQNENRGLEEQMSEMEKVLVESKMQLAEINGEHESLKQKWNDLRRAIA